MFNWSWNYGFNKPGFSKYVISSLSKLPGGHKDISARLKRLKIGKLTFYISSLIILLIYISLFVFGR